jgi:NADPH:quinone reductase-like Zn-dependent oxidoreductase
LLSVRFHQFGEPTDVLRVEEVEAPRPGRGEALLRLTARPINPSDLLTIRRRYGSLPSLPATPGWEGAGVVEAVGAGVKGLCEGQRVIPMGASGTWQQYLAVDAESLLSVPDEVDDLSACQALLNPLAAWAMLHDELTVKKEEWLIQNAAASALGRVVIQLARRAGARTINVVRKREQLDELLSIGADAVICTADETIVDRVKEIVPDGARYALDAVGGQQGWELVRSLRPGGTALLHGSLSHPETMPLNNGLVLTRSLTLRGFWLTEWRNRAPISRQKSALEEILALMARGALALPPVQTFPMAEVVAAVAASDRGEGKVVLVG